MSDELQADLFPAEVPPPADIPGDVATLFEAAAVEVFRRGFARYSADAVGHRVRWHEQIEKGNRDFTVNNNHIADLARWVMRRHPEMAGFFETRVRKTA